MNIAIAITFVLIVLARITDMTLDTIRTASIVQGRRVFAAALGFFQSVIYVLAIAKVLLNMDHPIYALAYGMGFALGTYLGITIEQKLAFGTQMASLFTRKGAELARTLLLAGYRLAKVEGQARDGDVTILYVEVARKRARKLIKDATVVDETCFCVLNDIRVVGFATRQTKQNVIPQERVEKAAST